MIPDSVTSISAGALQVSPSAAQITAVTLGKNVKAIDEQAFSGLCFAYRSEGTGGE